jgi:hypothetical protein
MLKKPVVSPSQPLRAETRLFPGSVLASFRPSTYPRGYASALHSLRPCWMDFLSILRVHSSVMPGISIVHLQMTTMVFKDSLAVREHMKHAHYSSLIS